MINTIFTSLTVTIIIGLCTLAYKKPTIYKCVFILIQFLYILYGIYAMVWNSAVTKMYLKFVEGIDFPQSDIATSIYNEMQLSPHFLASIGCTFFLYLLTYLPNIISFLERLEKE